MRAPQGIVDETNITELEIGVDGRIYVFGASTELLEVLNQLQLGGEALQARVEQARGNLEQHHYQRTGSSPEETP